MTPARLRRLYDALPPSWRAAVPPGLTDRARAWARARTGPESTAGLEARLWGGFSAAARRDLTDRAAGTGSGAAEAAWILSRWHAAHGDFNAALAWIETTKTVDPTTPRARRVTLLEALYLTQTGGGASARALLGSRGGDPNRALIRAASWRPAAGEAESAEAEAATLAEINALFARADLQGLSKRDPDQPLSLDNLRGTHPGPAARTTPGRVTVILPAYRASGTLAAALHGLTAQSHQDLEILVVDDASPDATADVAADFAREDPRVRLIRQEENLGGYAARNRALTEATGDFLTVHDADDWSHPDKIALQMAHLARSGAPSNASAWVRVTPELGFLGPARVFPDLLGFNDSAMLFRRDLFARFGRWDAARIGADKELIWRFERLDGRRREAFRRRMILPNCPLTFGRLTPDSLTRTGPTHVLTIYHGLRREYREAADFWQRQPGLAAAAQSGPGAAGFFPAPGVLRPRPAKGEPRDLLIIGDFNFRGGAQKSALEMMHASRAAGLSVALLHYRRYDQDVTAPLADPVRAFARDTGTRIVAPGETLRATTVIVAYPPVFQEAMDRFPQIDHERLVVVVNQLAERDRGGRDVAYDPARVRKNLEALLGSHGQWAPISPRVRAAMTADTRYPRPLAEDWTPLIDADIWTARVPIWRGGGQTRPAIGRHGRDDPLKWPHDPAALRAAYCAGRPCEARFLGGAAHARARLRRWPANWTALPFDAEDVTAFLGGLDVFLHFPDPEYIEEFGRAPMEAMAVGVPVILPPEFEPTFGGGALYAAPDDVWPLVARLWEEREFWEARVSAGRAFVTQHCTHATFPGRLARLAAA